MVKITRKPREILNIEWSSNSWVHNFFRGYEYLFGRRYGQRIESRVIVTRKKIYYKFYTVEALLAFGESKIREFFKKKSFWFEFSQLEFALPINTPQLQIPWISFAIGFDTVSTYHADTGATSLSFSYTTTGSNRLLSADTITDAATNTNTGTTYNSVSMSNFDNIDCPFGGWQNMWGLAGPASGSNTLTSSFSGGGQALEMVATSYTGCNQSGQPDNHTTDSTAVGVNNFSTSITPNADNCWILIFAQANTGIVAAGTNVTQRAESHTLNFSSLVGDNNAAVTPPASTTMQVTGSVAAWAIILASIAPAASTKIISVTSVLFATIKSVDNTAIANIGSVSGVPNV